MWKTNVRDVAFLWQGALYLTMISSISSSLAALAEAVSYGSATAAISVTRLGTAPAMPYKTEIKELLDSEKN